MACPHVVAGVAPGSHDVLEQSVDRSIRRLAAVDLLIAHVPFDSRAVHAKAPQHPSGAGAEPRMLPRRFAWHWKRWSAMTDCEAIGREFVNQMLPDDELARLRQSQVVRSAQEIFEERLRAAPPPGALWYRCFRESPRLSLRSGIRARSPQPFVRTPNPLSKNLVGMHRWGRVPGAWQWRLLLVASWITCVASQVETPINKSEGGESTGNGGADARWSGASNGVNPYPSGSSRASAWSAGWRWAEHRGDRRVAEDLSPRRTCL